MVMITCSKASHRHRLVLTATMPKDTTVDRWHGSELVGHAGADGAVNRWSENFGQVLVSEVGQEARGSNPPESNDEAGAGEKDQSVAPMRVLVAMPDEEPDEERNERGDVERCVVEGGRPPEPIVVQDEFLEAKFRWQVHRFLNIDDGPCPFDRTGILRERKLPSNSPNRVQRRDQRKLGC